MTININGGSYSAEEIIEAIAASNDPQPDLSHIELKLDQIEGQLQAIQTIEARLHAIENKVANMPLNWSIN